jgi:hypothetical protein
MMCLLRKIAIFNLGLQRELVPSEHFLPTGICSLPELEPDAGECLMREAFAFLGPVAMRSLNGNAMCLGTIGPVIGYLLACSLPAARILVEPSASLQEEREEKQGTKRGLDALEC